MVMEILVSFSSCRGLWNLSVGHRKARKINENCFSDKTKREMLPLNDYFCIIYKPILQYLGHQKLRNFDIIIITLTLEKFQLICFVLKWIKMLK